MSKVISYTVVTIIVVMKRHKANKNRNTKLKLTLIQFIFFQKSAIAILCSHKKKVSIRLSNYGISC